MIKMVKIHSLPFFLFFLYKLTYRIVTYLPYIELLTMVHVLLI